MAHFETKAGKIKNTTKQWVKFVLKIYAPTRDNDVALYGSILNHIDPDWVKWSAVDLLNKMDDKTIPNFDDVVRYRRRFQQTDISLRGESYNARHQFQKTAHKALNYGPNISK